MTRVLTTQEISVSLFPTSYLSDLLFTVLLYRQKQNEQFFLLSPLKSNIALGHIIYFCLMSPQVLRKFLPT